MQGTVGPYVDLDIAFDHEKPALEVLIVTLDPLVEAHQVETDELLKLPQHFV